MKKIYLDHASSTPLSKEVISAMKDTEQIFGNPSAIHEEGRKAKEVLETARKKCANVLQVKSDEILFTSSATESVNLAIRGAVKARKKIGNHIITTQIEHKSVLNTLKHLEKKGCKVTYLPVDEYGLVSIQDIKKAITKKTILVSIMYANNEIGTIEPIAEIGKLLKNYPNVIFHTDAAQAGGALSLGIEKLGVDLLSLNGSKIYGPKGTGLLLVKNNITLKPIQFGGGQENGLRSGTENVSGAVGLSVALENAELLRKKEAKRLTELRNYAINEILKIKNATLNGHSKKRLPNNINISFKDIDGEKLVIYLDDAGISASTGSACTEKSLESSHVITALGKNKNTALFAVRFTLGRETTKKELDTLIKILKNTIKKIQSL